MPAPLRLMLLAMCLVYDTAGADAFDAVTLFTSFEREPPAPVRQAMEDELAAILSPISAEVVWHSLADTNPQERQCRTRLAVIHFQGSCDVDDLLPYGTYQWTLGKTHVTEGEIQPFCDIYGDAIRAYVAPELVSLSRPARELMFGRAVARVVAHELYHVFGQAKRHSHSGLMASQYTPEELIRPAFRFGLTEYQKLRKELSVMPGSGLKSRPADPGQNLFLGSGCGGCHGYRMEGTPFGPSLRRWNQHADPLADRLTAKAGSMLNRARSMKAVWPVLNSQQVAQLTAFLSAGPIP